MVFYSEKSKLLFLILIVFPTLLSLLFLRYFLSIGFLLYGIVLAFLYWIYFDTKYAIKDKSLHVRCGPFRWHIDIMAIKSIRNTKNSFSSPALSLNRLQLFGENVFLIISPEEQLKFIETLKDINQDIEY